MSSDKIKVLGINASPRNYGNTYKLLLAAMKGASMEGGVTELVNLYDYNLKPCLGCLSDEQKACRPPCLGDDDSWKILKKVLECDALIIATPVYWYGPSGQLKNLIDRLTVFENMILIEGRSWLEGKTAGVIACGAEAGAVMAISYLMVVLNSMGVNIPPWALAYYEGMGDALEREESVMDAVNVGRVVVLSARRLRSVKEWYDPKVFDRLGGMKKLVREIIGKVKENESLGRPKREKIISKLLGSTMSRT